MSEVRDGDRVEVPDAQGRGSGQEEQLHVQGAVAAREQEGLEELLQVQDHEGWRSGDTLQTFPICFMSSSHYCFLTCI